MKILNLISKIAILSIVISILFNLFIVPNVAGKNAFSFSGGYFQDNAQSGQDVNSKKEIERAANKAKIRIFTARPGIVIGKKGAEIEALRRDLETKFRREILIDIQEVRRPELDAILVGENIALQLVRRVAFRRAMKRAVSAALKFGAKGVRVASAGRLGGAEMARREWYREGRVPLHTLRADIDYGTALARTTYGVIGVKVWIFKGEVLP
jgi:small subunit ribosomal protein S3